ncbi:hypothetical protein BGY98DRAFT_992835 [Russula aff. rugulosa BPL654]|nr:hypothetical protein BGY98DRAFT_992835 [Russula aff. rugulosa BPL654]
MFPARSSSSHGVPRSSKSWTVGHIRASGERMSDVEQRAVEKENEKGSDAGEGTSKVNELSSLEGTVKCESNAR